MAATVSTPMGLRVYLFGEPLHLSRHVCQSCKLINRASLMAVAEFERSLIRERTKTGLVAARARGAKIGRPDKTTPHKEEILALRAAGASVRRIADQLGLAASSIQRILKSAVPQSSPAKNAA